MRGLRRGGRAVREVRAVRRGVRPEALRALDGILPPGRLVESDGSGDAGPVLWLGDGPTTLREWTEAHAARGRSGLWPLLLDALDPAHADFRPWGSGELSHRRKSSPSDHDPAAVLADWWGDGAEPEDPADVDPLDGAGPLPITAPFGRAWPGIAARPHREAAERARAEAEAEAEVFARASAREYLAFCPWVRLGLVAADSGAEALTAVGWEGPCNHDNDTAKHSAVVRDWEDRFGARVVAVGFDTLRLSVARPPVDEREALLVAAEHFAFCPDNIWQGGGPDGLSGYARELVGAEEWHFWWD
ncbi:DUF4253 domain-containing protein [Streptomyces sp. NPDC097619]|uniref:DUF4253 domain-containing protein n=1 Tax=Streptomyces sp. NPDC097619 TaxID=3157228 RepID=UPI00331A60E9